MDSFPHCLTHREFDKGLDFEMVHQTHPLTKGFYARVTELAGEVSRLNMPDHIQPTLFHVVHKVDERATGPRVPNQQEHLRSPEFDVVFARVQK